MSDKSYIVSSFKGVCHNFVNFINSLSGCDIAFSIGIYCLIAMFVFSRISEKKNNTFYLSFYLSISMFVLLYNAIVNYLVIGQFVLFNICLACKIFVIVGLLLSFISIIDEIFFDNPSHDGREYNNNVYSFDSYNRFYDNNEKKYGEPYVTDNRRYSFIDKKNDIISNKIESKEDMLSIKEKLVDLKDDMNNLSKRYNDDTNKIYKLLSDRNEKNERIQKFAQESNNNSFSREIDRTIESGNANLTKQVKDILSQQKELKQQVQQQIDLIESKDDDIRKLKEKIENILDNKKNEIEILKSNNSNEIKKITLEREQAVLELQKKIDELQNKRQEDVDILNQQVKDEKEANRDKDLIIDELKKQVDIVNNQKKEQEEELRRQIDEAKIMSNRKDEQVKTMRKQLEEIDYEINKNAVFEKQQQEDRQNRILADNNNIVAKSIDDNIAGDDIVHNIATNDSHKDVDVFDKSSFETELLSKTEQMMNKRDELLRNDMSAMRKDINMLGKSLQSAVDRITELFDFMTFALKNRQ